MTPGNHPNIQNVPVRTDLGEDLKKALLHGPTSKHLIVGMDFSGIEKRVNAAYFVGHGETLQIHDEIMFCDYGPELLSQVQAVADHKPENIEQIMAELRDLIINHPKKSGKMLAIDSLADLKKEYIPFSIEITKPRQSIKAKDPYIPTYYWIPEFQI